MRFALLVFLSPSLAAAATPFQTLSDKSWSGRIDIRLKAGLSASINGSVLSDVRGRMLLDANAFRASRVDHRFGEPTATRERRTAIADACQCEVPDLTRWVSITPHTNLAGARALVAQLNAEPNVDVAFLAPRPYAASISVGAPAATPSWTADQFYLNAAPEGLGVLAVRHVPGGSGAGVKIADVEGTWYAHEDLPTCTNLRDAPSLGPEFGEHGTAVLGEMFGRDNGYGITGIAPQATCFTSSHQDEDVAGAIDLAAQHIGAGDIMVIEVHIPGPNTTDANEDEQTGFVPAEWDPATYDSISTAVAKGIIVVAAAGNGAQNLDDPIFEGYFDRTKRSSGSILVGAAASIHTGDGYAAHEPEWYSNYGSRVDVHAYGGYDVYSTGYGDLQGGTDGTNQAVKYTAVFAGTSSATPMISAVAALLQAMHKAAGGAPMKPAAMLAALQSGGTPADTSRTYKGAIGVMPDLEKAMLVALDLCGDGKVEPGEVCDDGNTVGGDGCSANCKSDETCGNATLDPGEVCDDGNLHSGDGCSGDCTSNETCGNGIIDSSLGEVCDDGNTEGGDGCAADCRSNETCGNGVLDPGEICDDGNHNAGDGCSANCQSKETCGNGIVDTVSGEACDDGSAKNGTAASTCAKDCQLQSAANGTLAISPRPADVKSGCAAAGAPLPMLVLASLLMRRRRRAHHTPPRL